MPSLKFEKSLWRKGLANVAGLDEVGRGAFAGPVVVASVIFDKNIIIPPNVKIDDSKRLSEKDRQKAKDWIKKNALISEVGSANVNLINKYGIKKATEIAFRKTIKKTSQKIILKNMNLDFLLLDAFYIPYVSHLSVKRKKQLAIIRGDTKSLSIAGASIIAKVSRDQLMKRLSKLPEFEIYAWNKNKGYGTRLHREVIFKHGITRLHRKDFVKNYINT